MNQNHTHITLVVDRSGSMQRTARDAEGGINAFLTEQKAVDGTCGLTLVEFSTTSTVLHDADLTEFTEYRMLPLGNTALYDAVGTAITTTGARLAAMPEDDRPAKVVFVVVTDGQENSSVEYTGPQIKEMIGHQEATYGWQFVFLASGIDTAATAHGIGISNAASYMPNGVSTRGVYGAVGQTISHFRTTADTTLAAVPDVDAEGQTVNV